MTENKEKDKNIWNDECELLLADWSEKASCYRWLHGRCEKSYKKWYYCFSIPVIILSTLTGAANVGMDSFVPADSKSLASAIVGSVNIFAGIISTLQNFLKVAELMEAHRIAGVSWGKLQRNIAIELALSPDRRVLQGDFLKLARAEYDRLIEAGPLIDDGVIFQFNKKFSNYEVSKPSICNGLDKCIIYKIDESIEQDEDEFKEGIEDIVTAEEKKPIEEIIKEVKEANIEDIKIDDMTVIKVNTNEDKDIKELTENQQKDEDTLMSEFIKGIDNDEVDELIIPKETNDKDTQTTEDSSKITDDKKSLDNN